MANSTLMKSISSIHYSRLLALSYFVKITPVCRYTNESTQKDAVRDKGNHQEGSSYKHSQKLIHFNKNGRKNQRLSTLAQPTKTYQNLKLFMVTHHQE